MDRHSPFAAQSCLLPDGFIENFGGEDFARVCHQQVQNCVLRWSQGDSLSFHGDGLGAVVQGDAANGDVAGGGLRTAAQGGVAPQLGTDSGQYLHRHKGLCDVVVRACVQAQDFVLCFGLGGEQDDGGVGEFPDLCRGR